MKNPPLDLSQLALDRTPDSQATHTRPRRNRWIIRYLIPFGILVGFIALLATAAGRRLMPAQPVTVVPVVVKRAEQQPSGSALFQSPGWIEPRPTAISVAALAPGVIEELMVVEGQPVSKDQPIARLISIDAELNVEQAKNQLAIREGELARANAELSAARVRFDNPVHLQVQLADARSKLANVQTELAKLPFMIEGAEANTRYTLSSMEGKQSAKGAISGNIIARAESEHAVAVATLQELRQRMPNVQREARALEGKVEALDRQLALLVEETRQVQEAEAKVQSAEALRNDAALQLRQAELTLDRNVVRAPIDGRVLRLIASPGTRVMGLESNAGQSSSTVIEMYDPNRLQIRADVRLEDVPMVTQGQLVEIETASSSVAIKGRVLQVTSSANIQKNTLEVKVELIDPPLTIRPEMLVTATFLAPEVDIRMDSDTRAESILAPRRLVLSDDSGAYVWIVDESDAARRQSVVVGRESGADLVEIASGLNPTDKLIASGYEGLSEGSFVKITGDDPIVGMN
ncbi:HlyD family efflux transporter periplasmic adaptor subunit [Rubripirellula amarantea]|nr:HlyD family efflux transporter periplasmic adaptor subunit [Rubripirellula amarantea]